MTSTILSLGSCTSSAPGALALCRQARDAFRSVQVRARWRQFGSALHSSSTCIGLPLMALLITSPYTTASELFGARAALGTKVIAVKVAELRLSDREIMSIGADFSPDG